MKSVKLQDGTTVRLGGAIGEGGEGKIFDIASRTYNRFCAKVYHDEHLRSHGKALEDKILTMVGHPPKVVSQTVRICWPYSAIYYRNKFIGFLMPKAFDSSVTLKRLIPTAFERSNVSAIFKKKFTRKAEEGLINRMKIIVNMAAAYHGILSAGRYHIVDMKHENVLVGSDAKISIVDCDSFEVNVNGKHFPAPMITPNYTPPEYYPSPQGSIDKRQWDNFTFAVLSYEILIGIHPYGGNFVHPHQNGSIQYNIEHGLFVHKPSGNARLKYPLQSNHPHKKFDMLPSVYRDLFIASFTTLDRPSIDTYGQIFFDTIRLFEKKN